MGQNILGALLHIFRGSRPQPSEYTPLFTYLLGACRVRVLLSRQRSDFSFHVCCGPSG